MAQVNGHGFSSLGKAIADVLATSLHHAFNLMIPHLLDHQADRRNATAEDATNAAAELLSPIFAPLHDGLDPDHPLHPVVGLLAGKRKD